MRKYKERLKEEFLGKKEKNNIHTRSYRVFKQEQMPHHLTLYERYANYAEKTLKISASKKDKEKIESYLSLSHLETSASGVLSLAVGVAVLFGIFAGLIGFFVLNSLFLIIIGLVGAIGLFFVFQKLPEFFANTWRLKASNQMVQCIFYTVTFMRHTSNLEQAIRFAAEHINAPLAIDMKKVLWDTETGKHSNIEDALEIYLKRWQPYNPEFIESMHLIESSRYETTEERRLISIDKALSVMLEETYEKMLRYAHNLKNPLTMLYMLGVVLPILGLVILPMIAGFMTTNTNPLQLALYIAVFYNIALPATIYIMAKLTLSKRPTGYGQDDISEHFPVLKNLTTIPVALPGKRFFLSPKKIAIIVAGLLFFIGIIPLLFALSLSPEQLLAEQPFAGCV